MCRTLPGEAARLALLSVALAAASPALAQPSGLAAGDVFYGAEAGLFTNDNVPGAQAPGDVVADAGWMLDAHVGRVYPVRDHDSLSVTANFRSRQYQRFHGLNKLALGAGLNYRTKFGLGPYVPRVAASLAVAAESFGLSLRNGLRSSLSLQAGKRLTPQWDISAGYSLERFDASNVQQRSPRFSRDAFSIQGRTVFARVDYAWSDNWLGFLNLSHRRGDVVATTRPEPTIFNLSSAIVADPAFGPEYVAYKLSARTNGVSVGASYALGSNSSLNIGLTREDSRGEGSIRYVTSIANASFVYSY